MQPQFLLDGLNFAECPRWRGGKLWFSDIFQHRVMTVDEHGNAEVVVQFGDDVLPAGLGFLPDGRVLMVDMKTPQILRLDGPGQVTVHADVSHLANGSLNDMVTDNEGRAYVGAMGTNPTSAPRPLLGNGSIILVQPDGSAAIVADEMDAPNGPCITNDGRQYIVSEFPAKQLIGFDRAPDGSISNKRVWADLSPGAADGICVDSKDGVWTASPLEHELRRVTEGGAVTDVIPVGDDKIPLVCCLGGHDGRTLFVLSSLGGVEAIVKRTNTSVIDTVRVEVPGW